MRVFKYSLVLSLNRSLITKGLRQKQERDFNIKHGLNRSLITKGLRHLFTCRILFAVSLNRSLITKGLRHCKIVVTVAIDFV